MYPPSFPGRHQLVCWALIAYGLAGAVYLLWKGLSLGANESDFKYVWFAGHMWLDGDDPYSERFNTRGLEQFVGTNVLQGWSYPPSWWVISCLHALFPIETATVIWRLLNIALVFGGCGLLLTAHRRARGNASWVLAALLLGFVATMQATAMTLAIGQTAIVSFFGLCVLAHGTARRSIGWQALAVTLLLLKPQVGLAAAAAVLASGRHGFRVISIAAAASLLLALPAFTMIGVGQTVQGLLDNLAAHDRLIIFSPPETTGLRHLLHLCTGFTLPGWVALSGAAFAVALVLAARWRGHWQNASPSQLLAAILAPTLLWVPLHSYDLLVAAPLALAVLDRGAAASGIGLAASLLLLARAGNLADAAGCRHPETIVFFGSSLESLVLLPAAAAAALHVLQRPARPEPGLGTAGA